jgi:hypothetical protein
MTTLVTVPQSGTALDVLAERYRAAFEKMEGGREQWIEGTLDLAVVVAEARVTLPDHRGFSQWLQRYQLEHLHPNDRFALIGFSRDLKAARKMLEDTASISWRSIWEKQQKVTPTKPGKGDFPRGGGRMRRVPSGAHYRKQYVPTVMRDETPMPAPKPRKELSEMFLSREQVDPDFKGTPLEFATKYGHVLLHTKDQIEQNKQQEALQAWVGTVVHYANAARYMLAALANVDPAALAEWTSKPSKADKLRGWCDSTQVACEAIRKLCPNDRKETESA